MVRGSSKTASSDQSWSFFKEGRPANSWVGFVSVSCENWWGGLDRLSDI